MQIFERGLGTPQAHNRAVASEFQRRVTLAELVATLSLVADLGMGRPMERVLRQTVIAMRLGAAAGMGQLTQTSAYSALARPPISTARRQTPRP